MFIAKRCGHLYKNPASMAMSSASKLSFKSRDEESPAPPRAFNTIVSFLNSEPSSDSF